ncbi:MAG: carbamoyltransferase [Microthrixaceae bacterium]
MLVLGISCDYHDSAAALVDRGKIVAAVEEERLSRVKHDSSLPVNAVASCLAIAGIGPDDVDTIVFHEKPLAVLSRVIATRQRRGPRALPSFARDVPHMLGTNMMIGYRIQRMMLELGGRRTPRIVYGEHHTSHAAAAFLPSPFESAAILTVDGIGEWSTASIGYGSGNRITVIEEMRYPNSLGLLYTLMTTWCGFEANDGEYKLMGLAPYGEPRFADALSEVVQRREDGSIHIEAKKLRWWSRVNASNKQLVDLFDGPPRQSGEPLTGREADLARSIQEFTERTVMKMAERAVASTSQRRLCMAGGVALNCVANGKLLRSGLVDDLWIQPAAGDAGSAIGAALWWVHNESAVPRQPATPTDGQFVVDTMDGAALGPSFAADETITWLDSQGIDHLEMDADELCDHIAAELAAGKVVGWFHGPMEFGPRALGYRSILADPRSPAIQRDLNLRVKGRESFRPFAPAVLWEYASQWFDIDRPAPYMLVTAQVSADRLVDVDDEPTDIIDRVRVVRSEIPACTHVDGSARVQTVHHEINPTFHRLITAFEKLTGCPVLLNTSFNRAGEPIVCTPRDAVETARAAQLDVLVIDNVVVSRASIASASLSTDANTSVTE